MDLAKLANKYSTATRVDSFEAKFLIAAACCGKAAAVAGLGG